MIAAFLFKNPRLLVLALIVIVVAGVSSIVVLPQLEDPVLSRRVGLVSTVYPGASPLEVESLVTIPIEEELAGIADIKQIRSNSLTGISNVVIELRDEVEDVDSVWAVVRDRIVGVRATLPSRCDEPGLSIIPLKAYAAILSVRSTEDDGRAFDQPSRVQRLRPIARQLRRQLLTLSGTEAVDVFGDPGEEFVVDLAPQSLVSTGLTVGAIAQQVRQHLTAGPAGQLRERRVLVPVDLADDTSPAKTLNDTVVAYGARGEFVPLSTIATIARRPVEPLPNEAIVDGHRAIVVAALVNDDLRVADWAARLDEILTEFRDENADTCRVDVLFSQREHIDRRMHNLLRNLGLGTSAVAFVVLILMGWRSMIVVASALPLSALIVLSAMRAMDIPIHQMSVTGLIVALGLLIDNAIVIVEDVRRRMFSGADSFNAIRGAVEHLRMPLFGSTLTTVLAFLPIATLPGPPGEFVGTIATSVILAILASFALAMTVVPALGAVIRMDVGTEGLMSYGLVSVTVLRLYQASLRSVLRFPIVGLLIGMALPIGGFVAARNLHEQFFPPSDRAQIQIEVEQPARHAIVSTREAVTRLQETIAGVEGVGRQHWFLGGSAPTFYYNVVARRRGTPFYAQAFVELDRDTNAADLVRRLQAVVDSDLPTARVLVRQLEQGPPFDAPVEVRLFGPDIATLQQLGSELRLVLAQIPSVVHTRSDLEETIPRVALSIDAGVAKQFGLNASMIAGHLYATIHGVNAGSLFDGEEQIPVRVKVAFDEETQFQQLSALPVSPSRGSPRTAIRPGQSPATPSRVTLDGLTSTVLESDAGSIVRIDGRRVNEVKAYLLAGILPSTVTTDFQRRLEQSGIQLPPGYTMQFGGETEQRSHAVRKLVANAVVLFALIALILVVSFRSFRCASIVATVGGLSIGLGPLALMAFGYPFGFMAIVGTMGLVGVAINDSIVVLAALRSDERVRSGGIDGHVTVVVQSTRHVLTTTVTTVVGFLPLILAGGGFWPPLAVTIAGGVGGATILALYTVPCLHRMMFRGDG